MRNITPGPADPVTESPEAEKDNATMLATSLSNFFSEGDAVGAILAQMIESISQAHSEDFREQLAALTANESTRAKTAKMLDKLRGLSTDFAKIVDSVRAVNPPESPVEKTSLKTTPGLLSGPRPKQTAHALHRVEQAIADHKSATPNRAGDALVHRVTDKDGNPDSVDVLFSPIDSGFFSRDTTRFFPPPTLPDLMKKLENVGPSGSLAFAVIISLAVTEDRPQINLNDLITEVGFDPRSSAERAEYRALLWECLQVFAQTLVVGKIKGNYRDKKGNPLEYIETSPVIAITGRKHPSEMRLDGSETPVAVEYTLGSFFYKQRGNKQYLAYIGDLRQLAAIPGGKAAGQWARCLGMALFQHWREHASEAEVIDVGSDSHSIARFKRIPTRRQLFQRVKPQPDPFEILLKSTDPKRARTYWDAAVQILVDNKIAVLVKKPGDARGSESRQDWQEAWLDESVDLRPHYAGNALTIDAVRDIAQAQKDRKRRTRGRRKKGSS